MNLDESKNLLDELDDPDHVHLTDWEINFIDSLLKHTDKGKTLSEKQAKILVKIHKDRVR